MSSAKQLAALRGRAPKADGTTNTPELRFTTAAGSLSNALPLEWSGRLVELKNESVTAGDIIAWHVSDTAGQTVAAPASAADGAAGVTRGRLLFPLERIRYTLPERGSQGGALFFNRIALANTPNISISLVE